MLSPLESAEGTLVTAAIRDISVRKAAEKQLAQMAPDAMVVVDQNGKIVLLNVQAEKQFGYSRDELLGQRHDKAIKVLLLIEDNPGDARLMREMFNDQGPHKTEMTHVQCMADAEAHLAVRNVDISRHRPG